MLQLIRITNRHDMAGAYGTAGTYEEVSGTFIGEVDPCHPQNHIIQDLTLAPRNERGNVEYRSDFILAFPKDLRRCNGVLRYDAPNRGTAFAPDSYFASRGYIFLTTAWQGDVCAIPGMLQLSVPVAINPDGSAILGPYRCEFVPKEPGFDSMPLPGGAFNVAMQPYLPASLDNTQPGYQLSRRINEQDPREVIPPSQWKFARCSEREPFPGVADAAQVCLRDGWDPKFLYELIYVAKDPKVMGLGLAAVRDMVAFFRHSQADSAGVANPVFGAVRYSIGSGASQSGNFLKTFLNLGFNGDLEGRPVFDGVYAQIAARQTSVNSRFAVPGGGGGLRADHTAFGQGGVRGLDAEYLDDLRGRRGGILRRCTASNSCPKLFVGLSGSEFYALQGSPLLTDAYGSRDLEQPNNVRIYFYSGSHHILGLESLPGAAVGAAYDTNGNAAVASVVRALYQDLEDWVVRDLPPPSSQVPTIADGTLVPPAEVKFPKIPGVLYTGLVNTYPLLDWGPGYDPHDESGIPSVIPPADLGRHYAILVPQVDADGNDIAGIRSVDIAAGLGTHTGWNYTNVAGRIDLASLFGAYFPYAKTRAERIRSGDPRASLEERYGNQAGYVAAVTKAARALVARRFMLETDAEAAIANAQANPIAAEASGSSTKDAMAPPQ